MNVTKVKKILANSLGGAVYGLLPILGHPNINYAVTDADEFVLVLLGFGSFGLYDATKHEDVKEFASGVGSGAFGLLGFDISFNLTSQLLKATPQS